MEQQPSIETVKQALQALYHNPDTVGKEKASVWLGELQKSVFAWQIADQLLQLHGDLESCYFAAQTMRTKIQYAFHELPAGSHQSLRDSLLDHATKITSETPQVILTQLCLALADLALQMATWRGAVGDFLQRFSGDAKYLSLLLELLTVLPEEIHSRSLRLGANRRTELVDELKQSSPSVLQLLSVCIDGSPGDVKLQSRVFRCLGSWFSVNAVCQDAILNSPLLRLPFQALMAVDCPAQLHESATDCVCSALYSVDEHLVENQALAQSLFQAVLALPESYHLSVAHEQLDKSLNYCRIFTEMAESFLSSIISSPNQGFGDFRTLELLLTCVGHHEFEVAEVTFNFWYRLSEELYQKNMDTLSDMFKPYVQRFLIALSRLCQKEPDQTGSEFHDFRLKVSDLIKDVIFIVGSLTCFTQMFDNLKSQSNSWQVTEASLFIMTSVAKNIDPSVNEVIPDVLKAIIALPESVDHSVRHTSILLIGELCEWIEHHPQLLDPVLQFLLAGLQQARLASAAATALQNICSTCRDQMVNYFPGLIQVVEAMDTFHVSHDAAIGLLKGTALILARMPVEKIADGLQQLCSYQISRLNEVLDQGEEIKKGSKNDPVVCLDRLAAIFRHTNPTVTNGQVHPCQPVVQEIWPVLSRTWEKYQSNLRVIERCCRCIRFAIRAVGKGSASLLSPLVTQMVTLYQMHQHSCFLYLGSILVDEYGESEPGCTQGLVDMLQAFCPPTFKVLEEENGLRNHPDTVDDLFRLCSRFLQKLPTMFLQLTVTKPLLCCAIAACTLDHREANESVMKFLTVFIHIACDDKLKPDYEARRSRVIDLLQVHGQTLVASLLHASLFYLPSYMLSDIAEVIEELITVDRSVFCKWLEETLGSLPTESSGGAVTATQQQLAEFHKIVTGSDNQKQVSQALRDFSRLYR